MSPDDIESEFIERVTRDDLEDIVRQLAEAVNVLATRSIHSIGGRSCDEVVALTNRAVKMASDR